MNINPHPLPTEEGDSSEASLAERTLALLAEWQIEATPPAYEVVYIYLSGSSNEAVGEPLAQIVAKSGQPSAYDLYQIHAKLKDEFGTEFVDDLKSELSRVLTFVESQAASSDRYQKRMASRNEQARNIVTSEQLNRLIGELVEENRKMVRETGKLKDELRRSGSTIQNLEKALTESREKEQRDPLTELGNRRYFDEWLDREIKRSAVDNEPLCLAIADIDHFKKINDSHGHPVGDAVLCLFARIIRNNVKGRDRVARYGGEEFALILPQTRLRAAVRLLDKIRSELAARNIVIVEDNLDIGKVTASFGVVEYSGSGSSEDFLNAADRKLYEAKDAGRNCVRS